MGVRDAIRRGASAIAVMAVLGGLQCAGAAAATATGGDLWTYGTAGTGDTQHPMRAGTNPSIAGLLAGPEVAYQQPSGLLGTEGAASTGATNLAMLAGTSPSIALLLGGGYEIAYQANTGLLRRTGTAGTSGSNLYMSPGTSPSIAGLASGGYEIAFNASGYLLWRTGTQSTNNLGLGMAPGSSPSIAAQGSGYVIELHANDGNLWTAGYTPQTGTNDHLAMASGTSPSVVPLAGGGGELAFHASIGMLGQVGTAADGNTMLGMAPGTSPSIAGLAHGGFEIAFQANTGHLWVTGSAGTQDTGLGMAPGTSPSIAPVPGGGYEVAFQATPPPPGAVVSKPVSTPVPQAPQSSHHPHRRTLHVKILLRWTWNYGRTRLDRVHIHRLPHHALVTVRCRGRGCPAHRHLVGRHKLRAAERLSRGAVYHAGDRILVTIRAKGYRAERFVIAVRFGTVPAIKLL